MSPSATVWLIDGFFSSFEQQWNSMAQRNRLYQALIHAQYLFVGHIRCWYGHFHETLSKI